MGTMIEGTSGTPTEMRGPIAGDEGGYLPPKTHTAVGTLCGHKAPGEGRRCQRPSTHFDRRGQTTPHSDGHVYWTDELDGFLYEDSGLTRIVIRNWGDGHVIAGDPPATYGSGGPQSSTTNAAGGGLQDSGRRETALGGTGAMRERAPGKGRYDLISPAALRRLALQLEAGGEKYGDPRNWEKGQPLSWFYDSAIRHLYQWLDGDRTEDHLAAALWNVHGLIHTSEAITRGLLPAEINDLPTKERFQ